MIFKWIWREAFFLQAIFELLVVEFASIRQRGPAPPGEIPRWGKQIPHPIGRSARVLWVS